MGCLGFAWGSGPTSPARGRSRSRPALSLLALARLGHELHSLGEHLFQRLWTKWRSTQDVSRLLLLGPSWDEWGGRRLRDRSTVGLPQPPFLPHSICTVLTTPTLFKFKPTGWPLWVCQETLSKLSLKEIVSFSSELKRGKKKIFWSLDFSCPMFWESEVEFRLGCRLKEVEFTEEGVRAGEILFPWRGIRSSLGEKSQGPSGFSDSQCLLKHCSSAHI